MNTIPATSPFTVFPAIDLRAGKVVRLAGGDPDRQTTYADDPLGWAQHFKAEGAAWLHVINLSGAFGEDPAANLVVLKSILGVGLKVEFGGGLRDQDSIRAALELGVERIFLGTAAIQTPELVDWALAVFGPQRIAADIGAQGDRVMVRGWQQASPLMVNEAGLRLRKQGVDWCVLTDVARDGVSKGVNVTSAVKLQETTGLKVVASGGVDSLEDMYRARRAGLAGVIIGRALYEGKIALRDALAAADRQEGVS
jgi:phosphoribosylformimino-5-aminoimidazole carboxamide ribotide isomerase